MSGVSFDLAKAFDSASHNPLFNSTYLDSTFLLFYCLGLIVIVNGSLSSKSQVTSCVPQGSILGRLLFIIYTNDIDKLTLLSSATLTHYTDYILLF